MAAYYKVDVSLSTNSVTVGSPSPQEVIVTLPLVGPAGPAGPAGTGLETLTTQGDILYQGSSTGQRLPIGTAGQVLKVSGGIPAWGAESGAVSSVAGRTGAVTLAVADVSGAQPTINFANRKIIYVSKASAATDTRGSLSPYSSTVPFATLLAAKNAAIAGDVICVEAGLYVASDNLAKNQVDWYFYPNAVLQASNDAKIFTDESGAMSFGIYGYAKIICESSYDDTAFSFTNAASSIIIQIDEVEWTTNNVRNWLAVAEADIYLSARKIANSTYDAFEIGGDSNTAIVDVQEVFVANSAVEFEGNGLFYAKIEIIKHDVSGGLDFVVDTGPNTVVHIGIAANAFSKTGSGKVFVGVPTTSSAAPQALGVAAAGTSADFARADHVHAMPSAGDVGAVGTDDTIGGNKLNIVSSNGDGPVYVQSFSEGGGGVNGVYWPTGGTINSKPVYKLNRTYGMFFENARWHIYENSPVTQNIVASSDDNNTAYPHQSAWSGDVDPLSASDFGNSAAQQFQFVGDILRVPTTNTANLPLKTGTNGVIEAGAFGTAAGSFCEGNDARLSDARTPSSTLAHKASHATGGTDALSPADIGAATTSHTHAAADVTSGTLNHERGGLEADVSAYNGLVKIASGSTSAVTVTSAGEALLDDADAAAQRTTLGLGTAAVEATTAFAASGSITSSGLTQATARILGRTTASTGAVEEIQIGSGLSLSAGQLSSTVSAASGGITAVGASTADVLSVSGSDLVADDGGTIDSADPFIKWNDTAGKLVYANPLSRPTGAFYVGLAPTTTALGSEAVYLSSGRTNEARLASGTRSIAIGYMASAEANVAIAIGTSARANSNASNAVSIGDRAIASNSFTVAIGNEATASSAESVAVGSLAVASAVRAAAFGEQASASLRSQFATRPFNAIYWGGQTTNATATVLNLDATATNRFTIAANTALAVDILLVARRSDTADKWLVARRFLGIRRDGSNNTSLIGSVEVLSDQSSGSPTWTFALTADDTNEALQLEVTGAASETIQWRATAFYRVA
jgi:hypothetical protein